MIPTNFLNKNIKSSDKAIVVYKVIGAWYRNDGEIVLELKTWPPHLNLKRPLKTLLRMGFWIEVDKEEWASNELR